MRERFYSYFHWVIIIIAYTAFIWLDWKLLFVGVLLYWLEIIIFKACVISIAQFGNTKDSFMAFNINKVLKTFHKEQPVKNIRFFLDWILPLIFLGLGYILQNYVGVIPLVKL